MVKPSKPAFIELGRTLGTSVGYVHAAVPYDQGHKEKNWNKQPVGRDPLGPEGEPRDDGAG
jgi:hypothetical protein